MSAVNKTNEKINPVNLVRGKNKSKATAISAMGKSQAIIDAREEIKGDVESVSRNFSYSISLLMPVYKNRSNNNALMISMVSVFFIDDNNLSQS